jgi:cytoskeleton protein RodZ
MSETLGEKLRRAREDRGYTVAEVSEQTRISPLYLESIENDDYGILPGGIFNKGFVKSYAKFVGINEQDALFEYSKLIASTEGSEDGELRRYKPEVLTDDSGTRSMVPTIIVALLILGVMTAIILFGLRYLRQPDTFASNKAATPANINSNVIDDSNEVENTNAGGAPKMESLTVEFTASSEPVSLTATTDGKTSTSIVAAGSTSIFKPTESLKLSYSRSLANFVRLSINGKQISLPAEPLEPKRSVIEFEISKDNLAEIWDRGAISGSVPEATSEPISTSTPRPTAQPKQSEPESTPAASPSQRPPASPKPTIKTPASTPRPPVSTPKPAANNPQ